jgi:hypothetical protein
MRGRSQGEKLIVVDRDSNGSFEVGNRIITKLLEGSQHTGLPRPKDALALAVGLKRGIGTSLTVESDWSMGNLLALWRP